MVGYAVTARIRCSAPPPDGQLYADRTDWWNHILTIPAPRVVVIQDVDPHPGTGGFIGEIHANVLKALGCVGAITNGSVRDLPAVEALGFQLFAAQPAVSHAYVHIIDFGHPVEVAGLNISPGDLLHGDRHGVLSVPLDVAPKIPAAAAELTEQERRVIEICRSENFSPERLRDAVHGIF
jgi:regulator of RNase E activity RraA